MSARPACAALALGITCIACSTHTTVLPWSPSAAPAPAAEFRAGFGRADITPAPGVPLSGSSIESRQAAGYRQRLYARALVLEDGQGERIAIVVADLPHGSMVLHRYAAEELRRRGSPTGSDRLVVATTHTHSGPGSFYDAQFMNDLAGALPGYDPRAARFYVERIAEAVLAAEANLLPARAAWGTRRTYGIGQNRSLAAFRANHVRLTPVGTDPEALRYEATDRDLLMLRVDQCPDGRGCLPAGALSVFAVHGTGWPSANDLIDADLHGLVARGLERWIDRQNGADGMRFVPHSFHLLANGAGGDVSPNMSDASRCRDLLRFRPGLRPSGPRTPPAPEVWQTDQAARSACLEKARSELQGLAAQLSAHAIQLFDSLGTALASDLTISRAVTTLPMSANCPEPRNGSANLAGAWDARARIREWRPLWFLDPHFEQGADAVDRDEHGCHAPKRIPLKLVQRFVGQRPEHAQLMVVRIGNALLGMLPAEVTTEAGMRMKRQMAGAFGAAAFTGIVGLANGYFQYITTREEYGQQMYEGASTLYGPASAEYLGAALASLAASLSVRPIVDGGPIATRLGPERSYFRPPDAGPPTTAIRRRVTFGKCTTSALVVRWIDAHPGRLLPARDSVLAIDRLSADSITSAGITAGRARESWSRVAWDDRIDVAVRAVRSHGDRGFEWEVRWTPAAPGEATAGPGTSTPLPRGDYRFVLFPRADSANGMAAGLPALSTPIRCPTEE